MIQVVLLHNGLRVNFGPIVNNLGEARILVKTLDCLHNQGCLPTPVAFYSPDTEVIAQDDEGVAWSYMDQDPSGASDGIWDLM